MSGLTSTSGTDRLARESIQRSWAGAFAPATQIDWLLLISALALTLLGFVMIGGATANDPAVLNGDGNIYIQRQVIAFMLGVAAAAVTTLFDYRNFRAWSIVAYGGAVLLLGLVLVAGTEVNGAQAWFRIGPLQFQPAEFAKIAIVLVLAAHFHEYREEALGDARSRRGARFRAGPDAADPAAAGLRHVHRLRRHRRRDPADGRGSRPLPAGVGRRIDRGDPGGACSSGSSRSINWTA